MTEKQIFEELKKYKGKFEIRKHGEIREIGSIDRCPLAVLAGTKTSDAETTIRKKLNLMEDLDFVDDFIVAADNDPWLTEQEMELRRKMLKILGLKDMED